MDRAEFVQICRALSVETRVRLLEALLSRPLCVNALAGRLEITPAAVSQHLRVLRDAGVLIAEKKGYFVHYRVNPETLARWSAEMGAFLSPPE